MFCQRLGTCIVLGRGWAVEGWVTTKSFFGWVHVRLDAVYMLLFTACHLVVVLGADSACCQQHRCVRLNLNQLMLWVAAVFDVGRSDYVCMALMRTLE